MIFQPSDSCVYVSTPRPYENKSVSWDCEAGYYCLGPSNSSKFLCTDGFYCPENTQPVYCCEGYYCQTPKSIKLCPEGHFCPIGTVNPPSCHYMAYCPPGSTSANKYFIVVLVAVFILLILILFKIKEIKDNKKNKKYKRLLIEPRIENSERTLDRVPRTFDIEFEDLGLVLPSGIEIMKGVSGSLKHGRTCAIMGPSGAGKTTLVSLLTGKVRKTNGTIKVKKFNEDGIEVEQKQNLDYYRKLIGFVPQEDIMLRELTIREILVHSALMRLPTEMPREEKKRKVIEVIKFLELSHVMDTAIGDEESRGISGGQRKRTNIGMELVAEPSILFLDEPTSGLDSTTALEVCKLLKKIAKHQGITVAAVIHSPSEKSFKMFDDLMLLGKGGRVVYFGPRDQAMKHFNELGFILPEDESEPDFIMEIASGREMPREEKKRKVIEVIKFLELSHVMDTAIGDEESRGISGGQRKRTNIGMELVAEPSILFLDEPTSGLDSTTALEVCKLLKKIAKHQGITVAAVIHSPSEKSFKMFDDLMLLGKGGRVVYFGPRDQAMKHFNELGFILPEDESEPDFIMEIASGRVKPKDIDLSLEKLYYEWACQSQKKNRAPSSVYNDSVSNDYQGVIINIESSSLRSGFATGFFAPIYHSYQYAIDVGLEFSYFLKGLIFWTKDPVRQTPNVFLSFILLFKRACLQIYRNRTRFLFDQLLHLGCGAFVSLATNDLGYIGPAPQQMCSITPYIELPNCLTPKDTLQTVGVFVALGVTFCGINAGITTFGYEKVVYWRDTSSGMKTIPYFLAKSIADIPRILLADLMFSLAFILFYSQRSSFSEIYVIVLLSYFASWELGYFLSAIFSKEKFGLVGTGFALAFGMVLSGATPRLDIVQSNDSLKWIYWMFDISAPRWAVEALYLKELDPRKWVEIHEKDLSYTYSFDDYPKVLNNILRIALAWSCLAFLAMKLISAPRWAVEALYLKELDPRKWVEIHEKDLSYTYSFDDYPKVLNNILRIALAWSCLAFLAMKLVNRDKQK
ncbi:hypothetical protein Glove_99g57 [Diversispora epigaea]|uniref:ABC transporter domain-containing protein n=1 Tax=Diversispora epigaea TaxID=1348612 RepID=A0A397JE09_9GLOM|nr:hypothetical protein Glove_99g57 [Diversispora epigaea]